MNILAISGSLRADSTNTAVLRALQRIAPDGMQIHLFDGLGSLAIFSPDLEGDATPSAVRSFIARVQACDALLICSPEYVHAIPGGLKNAIDWLVSGEQVVGKPIVLAHASHRGDDMLQALRLVLSTISSAFNAEIFLRLPVLKKSPAEINAYVQSPEVRPVAVRFLEELFTYISASSARS